jgi:hypothetical protein
MIGNCQVGCARSGNIVAVARYNSIMRSISAPIVVAPPAGARVQTRLRPSQQDAAVLHMVGEHLGRLAGTDLARRCALGPGSDGRTGRKRALTPASSSRWAGAITRTSNDQWQRGWRNLLDARAGLRRSIRVLQRRLAVPVGQRCGRARGYATGQERWAKQQRLQHLQARLARVERRLRQGRVSVCRGGRRLAKARHQLEDANLSEGQWRQRWTAERLFLTADGEAAKALGNETIRVHPEEGWLELKLPGPLAHLANRPHGRYRLSCPVRFTHRADEWAAQVASGAVRYDITYQPDRGRWYLAASWRLPASPTATVQQAVAGGVLAVDLNAGHLACWEIDADGNPVGTGIDIPLVLDGLAASTRDGRLRAAISRLLEVAGQRGCTAIGIEDLNFTDVRRSGRETLGRGRRGKRFHRVVAGIPTRQFRDRLVQMAANRGIAVVAIDPGWTSKWGATYWQRPLQARYPRRQITRHHAACVVLGRRALGLRARRRPGVPAPHRRMEAAGRLPAGAVSYRPGRVGDRVRAGHDPPATRPGSPTQERKTGSGDRTRVDAQVAQDRSVPSVSADKR